VHYGVAVGVFLLGLLGCCILWLVVRRHLLDIHSRFENRRPCAFLQQARLRNSGVSGPRSSFTPLLRVLHQDRIRYWTHE